MSACTTAASIGPPRSADCATGGREAEERETGDGGSWTISRVQRFDRTVVATEEFLRCGRRCGWRLSGDPGGPSGPTAKITCGDRLQGRALTGCDHKTTSAPGTKKGKRRVVNHSPLSFVVAIESDPRVRLQAGEAAFFLAAFLAAFFAGAFFAGAFFATFLTAFFAAAFFFATVASPSKRIP